ncbi:protease inhibitor Inh/omp19 family protein [Stappia sp. ES.058]|uniref:protease inhibitor Inh/omp19 family protein n=1 Tax=Stappia sp. ES.058 TaxID=1881061 RepID=UPI001AD8C84C|nr:protease inhibitor Inh/omp19 family protein [Stappia sp. ES.058]
MIRTAPLRTARLSKQMTAVICVTLALAGCQRLGYGSRSAPLPATPTAPVASQSLEPLDPSFNPQDTATLDGTAPLDGETQVAGVDPLAGGPPPTAREIGRSDMLGGWSLASGADNCKLFMTLTTWKGGYRANSRGCATPNLQTVSAWDLQGKQVSLKDGEGATIAELYSTGAERFSGRTASGVPISVFR